jgi:iron complex transport system substrate-binding protein
MKNKIHIVVPLLIIGVILLASLFGCTKQTPAPANRTVTDMTGRSVTLPGQVKNIVTLYGPGYEKLVMLGVEANIVACADWNKTHAAWAHVIYNKLDSLPAISQPSTPNIETLLTYKPDLVFWGGKNANVDAMANAGIPVFCGVPDDKSIESLKNILMGIAGAIGPEAVKKAEKYASYFDEKANYVTTITSKMADTAKPKVYVTSGIPLRVWGGNSVPRNIVEKAGGIFVSKDTVGTVTINYEQILQWNPDIIIVDHAPDLPDPSVAATSNTPVASAVYDQIINDPQMQSINAVKNHQVFISPTGAFFWDAGQQGILQLMWMAKIFHPVEFKDMNMTNELKDFYSKFFNYKLTNEQANMILEHKLPPGAEKWGY